MKRFRPSMSEPGKMIPADDGEWCLYAEREARIRKLEGALGAIAAPYDGADCPWPIPLAKIGAELRRRQKIASAVLTPGGSKCG